MSGSVEPARPERPTLIPNPAPSRASPYQGEESPIATGEGSRKRGVEVRKGRRGTVAMPACHVLFVPWRWPVRVILPCDCGNVRSEPE